MVLHELEAKRRDSIATLQNVDKNENVTQFLNRKLRVGENEVCNNKVDEISEQQDGGWGWFVTFGAFVINLIVDGIVYTFGLFFIELYEYFDESKSLTAWVGSVAVGMLLLSGTISSVLLRLFGSRAVAIFGAILAAVGFFLSTWSPNVRIMILLYGVLGGLGLGLMYLTSIVTVGYYFTKRRALATGIALAGGGVGSITFAPLLEFLINFYSWKGAMWIVSGICLHGVVMGALFRPVSVRGSGKDMTCTILKCCRDKRDKVEDITRSICDWSSLFEFSLLKRLSFLLYIVSSGLCLLSFFVPITFLPDHAKDSGLTSEHSVILISVMAVANSVSRVCIGWIADQPWSNTVFIRSVVFIIVGGITCFVPYFKHFELLVIYSVVTGGTLGVYMALLSIITIELVGLQKLTPAFGLVTMFMGVAASVASPIGGALADTFGNYNIAFYYAGAVLILAGLMTLPLRKISRWERERKSTLRDMTEDSMKKDKITVTCISFNDLKI